MKSIVALLMLSSVAIAQPMMMDPSKMSGIPRPDPQVPPGTITVRLIRGQLSNRMTGVDVALIGGDKSWKQKTDDQGRATFAGLAAPGPYTAKATDGVEELASQAIELQPQMGSRVMLVFQPKAGTADGVAKADKAIPAGTIIVRATGDGGEPAAGIEIVLGHAKAGERQVQELKGKTNGAGEATFSGLDAKPDSGYLAEAIQDGQRFASKPFKLQENMGSRVTVDVRPVSKDVSALKKSGPARTSSSKSPTTSCRWPRCGACRTHRRRRWTRGRMACTCRSPTTRCRRRAGRRIRRT